jgi:hypothetical protein
MKRFFIVFLFMTCMAMMFACQTTTDTSETHWTTGTFFFLRMQVHEHFQNLDIASFDVAEIREFVDSETPEVYRTITADTAAIKTEIASMFAKFDIGTMFPGAPIEWAKAEIDLANDLETIRIRILVYGPNDGNIGFLHTAADGTVVSQAYPLHVFASEIAAILDLISVVQAV